MSSKEAVMAKVLALQDLLVSQSPRPGKSRGLERLNRMMSSIKRVGCVENMPLNGTSGTYLIIEGRSWEVACRDLGLAAAPTFVMWEEMEFLSFLRSQVVLEGKKGPDVARRKSAKPSRTRAWRPKGAGRRHGKEAS
ncbi:MAG: hypothetical protein ACYTKD_19915 [Planctomycetota bacterium]